MNDKLIAIAESILSEAKYKPKSAVVSKMIDQIEQFNRKDFLDFLKAFHSYALVMSASDGEYEWEDIETNLDKIVKSFMKIVEK